MRVALIALAAFGIGSPCIAQVSPMAGGGDLHLQSIDYDAGQIVQLRGALGYQLMIELSPDEEVQNVALGDSGAWQVSVSKAGDRLFLKPTLSDIATNMTVVTSVRTYNFDLFASASPGPDTPYTVRFSYPEPKLTQSNGEFVDVSAASRRLSKYKISGDRLIRPASVSDDGTKTYVSWPRGAAIPAVYAPDRLGRETLVNGMMGVDDVFVIDGAPRRLIFRMDDEVARAERIRDKKRR